MSISLTCVVFSFVMYCHVVLACHVLYVDASDFVVLGYDTLYLVIYGIGPGSM